MEPNIDEIRDLLSDQWDKLSLNINDHQAECSEPDLDSLSAVEALLELDDALETTIPMTLVKPGGYQSKEEFVSELASKIFDHVKGLA